MRGVFGDDSEVIFWYFDVKASIMTPPLNHLARESQYRGPSL